MLRQNGASSLKPFDCIPNNYGPGPQPPAFGLPRLPKIQVADRRWPSKPCRGERNFWMQRREAKNRPERPQGSPETERVERYRAKIPTETAYREWAPAFAVS